MNKQELEQLKKDYLDHIQAHLVEHGNIFTHIALFGNKKDTDEKALVHVVVESKYLTDAAEKEKYATMILPKIAEDIKKQFTLDAVAWTSEGYMRTAHQKFKGNWKELPVQKEVLMILFKDVNHTESNLYEIKRSGSVVNSEGNLVDQVTLEELTAMEGSLEKAQSADGLLYNILTLFI